jgi:16S rRNA (adenine1518-N6/adenine1519-N6)-dimethyltransferase
VPRTFRPKLGQHFLTSAGTRERIATSIPVKANDLVVEIGPGKGAMTGLLAERAGRVVAVELDAGLVEQLKDTFRNHPRIEIMRGDILATDLAEICQGHGTDQCFVFGNLPYYITSPILHRLLDFAGVIRAMALLVQREVAVRITARPGSRAYGYLSVLAQLDSKPRIALTVPPGAFSPPPKVWSALVDFEMRPTVSVGEEQQVDREGLLRFVKACFGRKRKSLLNSLAGRYPRAAVEEALARLPLKRSIRAEQLSVDELARLYGHLKTK